MRRPAFFAYAACRGMNPNDFMPGVGERKKIAIAKAICATCPVLNACRAYSFESATEIDLYGIFGGLTRQERIKIMRASNVTVRRTTVGLLKRKDPEPVAVCGTLSAYQRHVRRKEQPCDPCRQANREHMAQYRERNKRRGAA